jgi:hypothetical protein
LTSEESDGRSVEGDASVHLEELVVGQLPESGMGVGVVQAGQAVEVELVGPYLRMSGALNIGQFRRVSDFLNNQEGLLSLRAATILRRSGEATNVRAESIWVAPHDLTLIGLSEPPAAQPEVGLQVPKVPVALIVVTPGHTMTGEVYISPEADLGLFIVSPSPSFIPMTDVRTRSLADRRITSRFPFALLNRRHMVATTQLLSGMGRVGQLL